MSTPRTLLYYPTMTVPTGRGLRQVILYWDELGSVVPQNYNLRYRPAVQFLKEEGVYRPFRPEAFFEHEQSMVDEFEKELKNTISCKPFANASPAKSTRVHYAKGRRITYQHTLTEPTERVAIKFATNRSNLNILDYLCSEAVAHKDLNAPDWYIVEKETAFIYLSLLAKYMAATEDGATVVATDRKDFEDLNFRNTSPSDAVFCFSAKFFNMLPVPRNDVKLPDILDFKRRRYNELLAFRQVLDEVQADVSICDTKNDVMDVLAKFDVKIQLELGRLGATLEDARIPTVMGSFDALFKAASPALFATAVVASGKAQKIADVPITWTFAGTIISGGIGIAKYLVDKRNERRMTLRNSAFSYLYNARRENIVH